MAQNERHPFLSNEARDTQLFQDTAKTRQDFSAKNRAGSPLITQTKSTAHHNDQRPEEVRAGRSQEDPPLAIFAFIWPGPFVGRPLLA